MRHAQSSCSAEAEAGCLCRTAYMPLIAVSYNWRWFYVYVCIDARVPAATLFDFIFVLLLTAMSSNWRCVYA